MSLFERNRNNREFAIVADDVSRKFVIRRELGDVFERHEHQNSLTIFSSYLSQHFARTVKTLLFSAFIPQQSAGRVKFSVMRNCVLTENFSSSAMHHTKQLKL